MCYDAAMTWNLLPRLSGFLQCRLCVFYNHLWLHLHIVYRLEMRFNIPATKLYGCNCDNKQAYQTFHLESTEKLQHLQKHPRCDYSNCIGHGRSILTYSFIIRRFKINLIDQQFKRRTWNWIGHTPRRATNNIFRQAWFWNPQGRRRRLKRPGDDRYSEAKHLR